MNVAVCQALTFVTPGAATHTLHTHTRHRKESETVYAEEAIASIFRGAKVRGRRCPVCFLTCCLEASCRAKQPVGAHTVTCVMIEDS